MWEARNFIFLLLLYFSSPVFVVFIEAMPVNIIPPPHQSSNLILPNSFDHVCL